MDLTDPWNDSTNYLTYAAKAHLELQDNMNELIVSIIPNTVKGIHAFYLQEHRNAYTPKFTKIKLN